MSAKNLGWPLIGFAIVIGILRLMDVIGTNVTAVLIMGAICAVGGIAGANAAKMKKQDEAESNEQQ